LAAIPTIATHGFGALFTQSAGAQTVNSTNPFHAIWYGYPTNHPIFTANNGVGMDEAEIEATYKCSLPAAERPQNIVNSQNYNRVPELGSEDDQLPFDVARQADPCLLEEVVGDVGRRALDGSFDESFGDPPVQQPVGRGNTGQTIAGFKGPVIPCEGQPRQIQRIGDRASWSGIEPTGVIGVNSAGQNIDVYVRDGCSGQAKIRTIVIGASIHGSENAGQVVAQELLFNKNLPPDVRVIVIPEINKAGVTGKSPAPRFNARGVNLNRNFDYRWNLATPSSIDNTGNYKGTGPASEPETQAIQNFLTNLGRSNLVISYHDNINWVAPSGPNASTTLPIARQYSLSAQIPLLPNNSGYGFFEAWYASKTGTPALLVELTNDSSAAYLNRHADAVVDLLKGNLVK
jgi:hypothetical protein